MRLAARVGAVHPREEVDAAAVSGRPKGGEGKPEF
jgi:hypothetical protein